MRALRSGTRLTAFAAGVMLWLALASIMGISASYFDSEQLSVSITASGARSWTQTNQTDFSQGIRVSTDIFTSPGNVTLAGRTEFQYALQGSGTRNFYRFNLTTSTWTAMAQAPSGINDDGSDLESDGDRYLYALEGGSRQFWRYDTLTNSWASMARTPSTVRAGGGLAFDMASSIYALRGANTRAFWRFDLYTGAWSTLSNTPGNVEDGGSLVADGKGHIYALQGNAAQGFWRFDASSNAWSVLPSTPAPVQYGGSMTYDGMDSIFAMPGWSTNSFWRFSISENRWYVMASLPRTVSVGGSLSYSHPGSVLAIPGSLTSLMYRYDIASNTWSASTSLPGLVTAGGALSSGPLRMPGSGSITSSVFDTTTTGTQVVGVIWSKQGPASTTITLEFRASDTLTSGEPSSAWVGLGSSSPVLSGLPAGRFLQWRAVLSTTNNHLTPVLEEVSVYYL